MTLVRSKWKRVSSRDRKELGPFTKLQECHSSWSMVNKEERGGWWGCRGGKGSDCFRVWRPSKELGFYSSRRVTGSLKVKMWHNQIYNFKRSRWLPCGEWIRRKQEGGREGRQGVLWDRPGESRREKMKVLTRILAVEVLQSESLGSRLGATVHWLQDEMHEKELWRQTRFCNPVGGSDRKEGVIFMPLLLSHDVYTMKIRRINTHSYKLSVESLYKMALYNMNILSRIMLGHYLIF